MTIGEVADLLIKDYSVYNALNLDGGGSTSLAMEDPSVRLGRIVNVPSDEPNGRSVGSNLAIFAAGSAGGQSELGPGGIARLAWLAGSWQTGPGRRRQVEEHWTQPVGAVMIGMGRTAAGGKTVEFEYLRIEERLDGIYYIAHPNARHPGTEFKLTSLTAEEVTFENPSHDFPKRIHYKKNSDGSITASVDGGEGTRATSFQYLSVRKR